MSVFSVENLRQIYRRPDGGPMGFVRAMHRMFGLRDKYGVKNRNDDGVPVLEDVMLPTDNVSIKNLAIALFGEDGIERGLKVCAPSMEEFSGDVLEAGNDIVPGNFANITAYNETVAGLLEARILSAYNRPEFVANRLTTTIPSNKVQEKFIGISTPADAAQERKPGQQHPRAELTERYVTTPITKNRANGIDITREAVMFDLTRQLLDHADLVASTLALRKEYLVMDTVLGITNTYTYDGTSYYTYVASSGNWVNVVNNDLTDWTCLDKNYLMFSKMTDQETGQPISVMARDLLVMPGRKALMNKVLRDSQVEHARNSDRTIIGTGGNPISGNWNEPIVSQYARKRLVDVASDTTTNGLLTLINTQNSYGWSTSDMDTYADGIWLAGDFRGAFVYVENLPLTVERAAPTSYQMLDRGLVLSIFCDEMGIPAIREPRKVIRNQGFAATTANW